uniref:Uncharacterized protein n=1 Tax=viral metagenome TaxID=1070528 RepID=A0A6C0BSD9_9ZZZZ
MEEINENVLNATDNFYRLKTEYEVKMKEEYKKARRLYLSKRTSMKGFKNYIKDLKFPCVNCKRDVNSIFSIKNYELKAKCGDLENPCRLNIIINRGIYLPYEKIYNGDGIIEGIRDTINDLKLKIIDVKTKYILKLITDVEAMSLFDKYYEEIQGDIEMKAIREDMYIQLINNEINDETIKEKLLLRNNVIQDMKKKMAEYKESERKDKEKLVEIVDTYITVLIPTIDDLNSLTYKVREMNSFNLDKQIIRYSDTQQIYYDPEDKSIISNVYGDAQLRRNNIPEISDDEEEYNFGD